jgi:flagellar biosynthesis protein FlhG
MLPGEITIPDGPVPYTVAIGGGKGGVGKSFIAAQTGLQFARSGRKTILIDLDFGGANLHSYFKMSGQSPSFDPSLLTGDSFDLAEWISSTEHPNLDVIYGSRLFSGSTIKPKLVLKLLQSIFALGNLGYKNVVLDLGAGSSRHTIDAFWAAHRSVIVVLPEPTSIENAYQFLRAVFVRAIQIAGQKECSPAVANEMQEWFAQSLKRGMLPVRDFFADFASLYPRFHRKLFELVNSKRVGFIVNQTRTAEERNTTEAMAQIAKDFFGFDTLGLGTLCHDESVWKAMRSRKELESCFPQSRVMSDFRAISQKMIIESKLGGAGAE